MKNKLKEDLENSEVKRMIRDQKSSINNVKYHNNCTKCGGLFWTDYFLADMCNVCIKDLPVKTEKP